MHGLVNLIKQYRLLCTFERIKFISLLSTIPPTKAEQTIHNEISQENCPFLAESARIYPNPLKTHVYYFTTMAPKLSASILLLGIKS